MKLSSEEFVNLTQPYELSEREKEDGMGAYLMMFARFCCGPPIASSQFDSGIDLLFHQ